jgi:phosphonate transport system ATP-binding protein
MLGDVNLAALSKADLRRQRRRIGMIFQEYALVERLMVMENVLSVQFPRFRGRLWAGEL